MPYPQELLLAPGLLEQLTCAPGSRELGQILTVPEGQQRALQGYRDAVCSGQAAARAQRFTELATELRNQLDMAKIAQQVRSCLPAALLTSLNEVLWLLGPLGTPGSRLCMGWFLWGSQCPPTMTQAPALFTPQSVSPVPGQGSPYPLTLSTPSHSCIPSWCSPVHPWSLSPPESPPRPQKQSYPPFWSALPSMPCLPAAGTGCPQQLRPPAADTVSTEPAGAFRGPAGCPEGSAGCECPVSPGPLAAPRRLHWPVPSTSSEQPWWSS